MGLVNSPAFPSSVISAPVKKSKKTDKVEKSAPVTEPVPEECCVLGCADCSFIESEAVTE